MSIALHLILNWDSLDAVRRIHSNLELISIVSFVLLAAFDILGHFADEHKRRQRLLEGTGLFFFAIAVIAEFGAYKYGQRNDELSEHVIRSLDTLANDAETKSAKAVTDAGAALTNAGAANEAARAARIVAGRANRVANNVRREAESIDSDLAQTKEEVRRFGPRYGLFVGKTRDDFKAAIKPFAGQKLVIFTRAGAGVEEEQLAELLGVLMYTPIRPSWQVTRDRKSSFLSPEVMLGVSKKTATASTLKAVTALSTALGAVGINDINGGNPLFIEDFPELPPDTIDLMIGEHIPIIKRALNGSLP